MDDGKWNRPISHDRYAISPQPSAMTGLYVHIPFCSAICNYCNFNRGLFDPDLKLRYVDALVRETQESSRPVSHPPSAIAISHQPSAIDGVGGAAADTIYFGGGTPSLLEPGEIARIIRACESSFDVAADREV